MKLSNIIILFSVIVMLSACSNMKNHKGLASIDTDTIVSSLPINYLKSLDNLDASQKIEEGSYVEMLELFEELNYTLEAWQSGIREVPRVYLVAIGQRWGTSTSKEITTLNKKHLFFRGLTPLILHANELILKDRDRLEKIRSSFQDNDSMAEFDKIWTLKLAKLYRVKTDEDQITASIFDELWKRVDIIAPSLALGQSATESGWGTSRFAAAGNALYGQWSWGEKAMKPKEKRAHLGDYGVAAFETLQESVSAYMLNLNRHNAYAELRDIRAKLRSNGEKITGNALAEGLMRYSERGESYVKSLKSMMEYNRLNSADDAHLSNDPPIFLIPQAN